MQEDSSVFHRHLNLLSHRRFRIILIATSSHRRTDSFASFSIFYSSNSKPPSFSLTLPHFSYPFCPAYHLTKDLDRSRHIFSCHRLAFIPPSSPQHTAACSAGAAAARTRGSQCPAAAPLRRRTAG
jgi:hypothetical protein